MVRLTALVVRFFDNSHLNPSTFPLAHDMCDPSGNNCQSQGPDQGDRSGQGKNHRASQQPSDHSGSVSKPPLTVKFLIDSIGD